MEEEEEEVENALMLLLRKSLLEILLKKTSQMYQKILLTTPRHKLLEIILRGKRFEYLCKAKSKIQPLTLMSAEI